MQKNKKLGLRNKQRVFSHYTKLHQFRNLTINEIYGMGYTFILSFPKTTKVILEQDDV